MKGILELCNTKVEIVSSLKMSIYFPRFSMSGAGLFILIFSTLLFYLFSVYLNNKTFFCCSFHKSSVYIMNNKKQNYEDSSDT